MNVEEVRDYALAHANVEESFPFDETTLVLKVNGKMFLLVSADSDPLQINVKCDPDKATRLREEYACIIPGYHMNKQHWNTIIIDKTLTKKQIKEHIDHSYELVASSAAKGRKSPKASR